MTPRAFSHAAMTSSWAAVPPVHLVEEAHTRTDLIGREALRMYGAHFHTIGRCDHDDGSVGDLGLCEPGG